MDVDELDGGVHVDGGGDAHESVHDLVVLEPRREVVDARLARRVLQQHVTREGTKDLAPRVCSWARGPVRQTMFVVVTPETQRCSLRNPHDQPGTECFDARFRTWVFRLPTLWISVAWSLGEPGSRCLLATQAALVMRPLSQEL